MASTRKPNRADAIRESLGTIGTLAENQKPDKQHTTAGQTTDDNRTSNTQQPDKRQAKKRYDIRLDPADWAALKVRAEREGISTSAIIRRLVKQFLTF